MNIEMFMLKTVKSVLSSSMVVKLMYRIRKQHSYGRKLLKVYIVKANNIQPGQTQHSVSSDLVLHCLHMSYLQTIRQLVTWTQSRPDWDRIVLSYKRKINLERKYFFVK